MSSRSEFLDIIRPLHDRLSLYDAASPPTNQPKNDAADPTRAVPQSFIDAMIVREEVYVKEQNIPLENELDEDDARSFHWVAYASIPSKSNGDNSKRNSGTSTKLPIGTIRLVPPPHPSSHTPLITASEEPYIKLGRLAVIPEFRKTGVSKLLIESALSFAQSNPYDVGPQMDLEQLKKGTGVYFKGLVVIHAQVGVQKVWRRYGFERDESAGEWDEEGIRHVLMWRRVGVEEGRRKSKVFLGSGSAGAGGAGGGGQG